MSPCLAREMNVVSVRVSVRVCVCVCDAWVGRGPKSTSYTHPFVDTCTCPIFLSDYFPSRLAQRAQECSTRRHPAPCSSPQIGSLVTYLPLHLGKNPDSI